MILRPKIPDCKLLCSGSRDRSIKFWNPADGCLVNDNTMKIWDAETFELKHTFEQESYTMQLTITADSNYIVSANEDNTVRLTSCREYTRTALTPILNLILHIVYKWEFVSFPEHTNTTPTHFHTIRLLGECVHHGGYNVTSEILSFLSPAHLPVQITPEDKATEN